MVNAVRVNADHGRDFHPLADHLTKLRNFTMGENRDFLAFRCSLHLMLEQALSGLILCLTSSQRRRVKVAQTSYSMLQWIQGRFGFSQTLFKIEEAPLSFKSFFFQTVHPP